MYSVLRKYPQLIESRQTRRDVWENRYRDTWVFWYDALDGPL